MQYILRIVRACGCSVVVAQWQSTGCTTQESCMHGFDSWRLLAFLLLYFRLKIHCKYYAGIMPYVWYVYYTKTYAGLIGCRPTTDITQSPALKSASPQPGKISDAMATRPTVVTVRLINLFLLLKQ